jgi:hypothetical protein
VFNPPKSDTIASITHSGAVRVLYNQVIKVHCQYNIKLFPFDTQECLIKLGPWEHNASEIYATPGENAADLSMFKVIILKCYGGGMVPGIPPVFNTFMLKMNTEWEIVNFTAAHNIEDYNSQQYAEVHWRLKMQRRPNYYVQVYICITDRHVAEKGKCNGGEGYALDVPLFSVYH